MGHPDNGLPIYCNIIKTSWNSEHAENKMSVESSVFIKAGLLAAADFHNCDIVDSIILFLCRM